MKESFSVRFDAGRPSAVSSRGVEVPVVTVRAACRRLKRSRRQVYRLMKAGVLPLRAKALGECLVDAAAVERLAANPACAQRLPAALAPLLPEYSLAALNAGVDADLVLLRVLEGGGRAAAAWALRRYGRNACADFVRRRGASLSPRSRAFWELMLDVRASPGPAWRAGAPWPA